MPAYLELCLQTWRRACPNSSIQRVDQSNLSDLSGGRIKAADVAKFSYPLQSDIAAVAVLIEQPGLFLDADTILLSGFDIKRYDPKKLTIYGNAKHLGNHSTSFLCTGTKENPILLRWLEEASRRIGRHNTRSMRLKWWLRKRLSGKPAKVPWHYLGNGILDDLLRDGSFSDYLELRSAHASGAYPTSKLLEQNPKFKGYKDLWFDPGIPVDDVVRICRDGVVMLQNSWHPQSYKDLTMSQVLSDQALVSRLIAHSQA